MSFMFSASQKNEKQSMNQETNPWAPAQPLLKDLLGKLDTASDASGLGTATADQNAAIAGMKANAAAGDPNAGAVRDLSSDLLSTPNRTGDIYAARDQLTQRLTPTANGANLDIASNPHLSNLLQALSDRAANRTNLMFAGAGRDLSPDNLTATARGVTEATAPILFDEYRRQEGRTDAAARDAYGVASDAARAAGALDEGRAKLRTLGIDVGDKALAAGNYGPEQLLAIENLRKQLPVDELGYLSNILNPIAGLGSQTSGNAKKSTTEFGGKFGFSLV